VLLGPFLTVGVPVLNIVRTSSALKRANLTLRLSAIASVLKWKTAFYNLRKASQNIHTTSASEVLSTAESFGWLASASKQV